MSLPLWVLPSPNTCTSSSRMARMMAVVVTARPSGVVLKYFLPPLDRWKAPHWIAIEALAHHGRAAVDQARFDGAVLERDARDRGAGPSRPAARGPRCTRTPSCRCGSATRRRSACRARPKTRCPDECPQAAASDKSGSWPACLASARRAVSTRALYPVNVPVPVPVPARSRATSRVGWGPAEFTSAGRGGACRPAGPIPGAGGRPRAPRPAGRADVAGVRVLTIVRSNLDSLQKLLQVRLHFGSHHGDVRRQTAPGRLDSVAGASRGHVAGPLRCAASPAIPEPPRQPENPLRTMCRA